MPFVTFQQVEHLLPEALRVVFVREPNYFEKIEVEAAKTIRDRTGASIPESTDDAPDWITVPAAYIIIKFASPRMSGKSDEFVSEMDRNFKYALAELDRRAIRGADSVVIEFAGGGMIGGVYDLR